VEDRGQDLVEYALLAGIIAIAGSVILPAIGAKMANAVFNVWGTRIYQAWQPGNPAP
jgi:hypothetical protein